MHIEKYIDDIYTCNRTRCGYCREECPIFDQMRFEAYSCRGRMQIARGVLEEKVKLSDKLLECIALCTTCGYCRYRCALHNVDIIEALRADLVERGITNRYHDRTKDYIKSSGNPLNLPKTDRAGWSEGLEFDQQSSVLFFAGCVYSYKYPEVLRTIITILNKIGTKVNYLAEKEDCCGASLHTTGYWPDFEALASKNIEIFKSRKIKKIVTPCPGCARTLKMLYNEFSKEKTEIEVLHAVEYFEQLIKEGKLVFKNPLNIKITWHDPCHLSRHLRIIDAPRRILTSIPGIEVIEMEHHGFDSKCCGAGGGMLSAYTDVALNIAEERLKEAEETGADYICTCCPTCESTFEKIIDYTESRMKMVNLFDLILQAIG